MGNAATRFTIIFGLLLVIGGWTGFAVVSRLDRDREMARVRNENAFVAVAFEEHARRVIRTADTALLYLKDEFEKGGIVSPGMRNFIRLTKDDLQAVQLSVAGPEGDIIYSAVPLKSPVNIRDREHFTVQRAGRGAGLHIGKPVLSRSTGGWTFFLSRRISRPDGSFGGTVMIGLDPFYFSKVYGSLRLGEERSGLIAGNDHIVRVRIAPTERLVGDDISGYSPVFREAAKNPIGHYEVVTIRDGTTRMASYRTMPDYPLVVIISTVKSDALSGWTHRLRLNAVAAALFTLFVAGFCFFLVRAQRLAEKSEEETRQLQARLVQSQKMEAIGTLAGGVAHDFNNMLGVIIGRTELAMDQVAPGSTLHENLEEIGKAAERSADVTRQLLAFARKQTIAPKVIDLNEGLESVLKMIRRLIGENIDLSWNPGRNIGKVKIDPSQVDQILTNLATNARDAITGAGRVTIETANATLDAAYCSGHPGFVPGDYVLLSVSDDGHGIARDKLQSIFDPFFTTKGPGKGTGLGLATVYGIVKQNGGAINVYSEPGAGTTFRIYLPRVAGEDAAAGSGDAPVPVSGGTETILVCEDETANLTMATRMLESLGYRVLAAGSPEQAISLASSPGTAIDLLLTDVVMPGMDGWKLHDAIIGFRPGLKCIFMSGYTANVIGQRGVLEAGVTFLQKPFSRKELGTLVRRTLDGGA
ncbi:MAG TPA: ATP-binding protein [Candidatus Deferrimicrobiaceae bacterium]|jgi:signal transduction histidine kinase